MFETHQIGVIGNELARARIADLHGSARQVGRGRPSEASANHLVVSGRPTTQRLSTDTVRRLVATMGVRAGSARPVHKRLAGGVSTLVSLALFAAVLSGCGTSPTSPQDPTISDGPAVTATTERASTQQDSTPRPTEETEETEASTTTAPNTTAPNATTAVEPTPVMDPTSTPSQTPEPSGIPEAPDASSSVPDSPQAPANPASGGMTNEIARYDFDDGTAPWETGTDGSHALTVENGAFVVEDLQGESMVNFSVPGAEQLTDGGIAADVELSGQGVAGLMARFSANGDNAWTMYSCTISTYDNQGMFACYASLDGSYTELVSWQASDAIVTDGPNVIALLVVGSQLNFMINGQMVAILTDEHVATGAWGIYIQGETPGFQARFNEIVVME